MRVAKCVGTHYEKAETLLDRQIIGCFEGPRGPGATPSSKKMPLPKAVIVPHDPYPLSGPCAAWSYKAIGDAKKASLYIILASPKTQERSGLTQEPFQTPYGMVRVDQDFARRLLEKGTIVEDSALHREETAIECQLPFLQFSQKQKLESIKILPLLISNDIDLQQLAVDIKEVLLETEKDAVVITATHLTSYGRSHHYVPFSEEIMKGVTDLDEGALEFIKATDHEGLYRFADEKLYNATGLHALLLTLRLFHQAQVSVEQYYSSSELSGDEKNFVTYASVIFT